MIFHCCFPGLSGILWLFYYCRLWVALLICVPCTQIWFSSVSLLMSFCIKVFHLLLSYKKQWLSHILMSPCQIAHTRNNSTPFFVLLHESRMDYHMILCLQYPYLVIVYGTKGHLNEDYKKSIQIVMNVINNECSLWLFSFAPDRPCIQHHSEYLQYILFMDKILCTVDYPFSCTS